ncbi:hypothetical protein [Vulcanisaeta sp. JCM 16161]|uniref:hypothetical protein n=1 Tax=Vulcanisaeta sp. JCM 16161 TaxID=1295372 RepID=UPI001FB2FCE9|nr:hypothetical protein [Vulcanisaeta sp. JCM 16161]
MSTQVRSIKARIYSIRRGAIGYSRDAIIIVPGVETAVDAAKFINARVVWRSKKRN